MSIIPDLPFKMEFAPIWAALGPLRSGKTAIAQDWVLSQAKAAGKPVFSNIHLEREGVDVYKLRSAFDVLHLPDGAFVLLDDVGSIFGSRESMSASAQLVARLQAVGHYDVVLVYTAPEWRNVDINLRGITPRVLTVKPLWKKKVEGQNWRRTTWSYARLYDTESLESGNESLGEVPVVAHGPFKLSSLNLDGYNTRADIDLIADHAICTDCGLKKRVQYCTCKHSPAPIPIASSIGTEAVAVKRSFEPWGPIAGAVSASLDHDTELALDGTGGAE